jgi:hypothetical protein
MSELDELLLCLAAEPAPVLEGLDGAVLAGLGRRRERQLARRTLVLAGGVAIFVGMAGALVPDAPASAEPLLGMPAAAPSHLLAD